MVAAVADGAGSALYAEIGSRTAVSVFADFVLSEIDAWGIDGLDDLALDAANAVHRTLRRFDDALSARPGDFATTLLAMVSIGNDTTFLQIGDGGIVRGPSWKLVFPPQHGEYRNESRFITDADAFDWIEIAHVSGPPGSIVLFTDGLEAVLVHPGTLDVHPPLFDLIDDRLARDQGGGERLAISAEIARVLATPDLQTRTDDDTSLIAIRFEEDRP